MAKYTLSKNFKNLVDIPSHVYLYFNALTFDEGDVTIDVSEDQDNSVVAWSNGEGTLYFTTFISGQNIIFPTDCSSLFEGCTTIQRIVFSNVDTSNVVNMSNMFKGCSALTNSPHSSMKTGAVTNMSGMFDGCSSLTSLKTLNTWITSAVTNMSNMFNGMSALEELNIDGWDTRKVTNMSNMFKDCNKLTSLNVGHFKTPNVTKIDNMFNNCALVETLDLSGFDTTKVTSMSNLFTGCSALKKIKLGKEFSWKGNTTQYLPATTTALAADADGNWYNNYYEAIASAEIPSNKEDTYYAAQSLVVYPISWEQVVRDTADSYREKTLTTEPVKAKELSETIDNLRFGQYSWQKNDIIRAGYRGETKGEDEKVYFVTMSGSDETVNFTYGEDYTFDENQVPSLVNTSTVTISGWLDYAKADPAKGKYYINPLDNMEVIYIPEDAMFSISSSPYGCIVYTSLPQYYDPPVGIKYREEKRVFNCYENSNDANKHASYEEVGDVEYINTGVPNGMTIQELYSDGTVAANEPVEFSQVEWDYMQVFAQGYSTGETVVACKLTDTLAIVSAQDLNGTNTTGKTTFVAVTLGTDGTYTKGTPLAINSVYPNSSSMNSAIELYRLSDNKCAVVISQNTYQYVAVMSVSGTTLSIGSNYSYSSLNTGVYTKVSVIDSTHLLMVGCFTSTSTVQAKIATISGTSVSFGTAINITTDSYAYSRMTLECFSTSTAALVWGDVSNNKLSIAQLSMSGTTVSLVSTTVSSFPTDLKYGIGDNDYISTSCLLPNDTMIVTVLGKGETDANYGAYFFIIKLINGAVTLVSNKPYKVSGHNTYAGYCSKVNDNTIAIWVNSYVNGYNTEMFIVKFDSNYKPILKKQIMLWPHENVKTTSYNCKVVDIISTANAFYLLSGVYDIGAGDQLYIASTLKVDDFKIRSAGSKIEGITISECTTEAAGKVRVLGF